jgi:hypothetical protein
MLKAFWPEGKEEEVVFVEDRDEEVVECEKQSVSVKKEAEVVICVDAVKKAIRECKISLVCVWIGVYLDVCF